MEGKVNMTISVGICTYNGEKYIKEQLESIINQTVKVDQIVISDDASTDKTIEIVEKILKKTDINYLISRNEINLGLQGNGEVLYSLLDCDIVIGCDQDNVWDLSMVEKFKEYFEKNPDAVYVFCNGYLTDSELNVKSSIFDETFMKEENRTRKKNLLINRSFPHGNTVAFKRSFLQSIRPCMFYSDEWIASCAYLCGKKTGCIDDKLVYFRRHKSALTISNSNKEKKFLFLINSLNCSFEEKFAWPYEQFLAYQKLYDLYKDSLDYELLDLLTQRMNFAKIISSFKNLGLIKREYSLIKLYKSGLFSKFRGNRNTFVIDFLYLLHIR